MDPPTTEIYTLSLHDALPISAGDGRRRRDAGGAGGGRRALHDPGPGPGLAHAGLRQHRSEEHTSELQSRFDLVCRLLLEKKKKKQTKKHLTGNEFAEHLTPPV